jgi:hypothetical protein
MYSLTWQVSVENPSAHQILPMWKSSSGLEPRGEESPQAIKLIKNEKAEIVARTNKFLRDAEVSCKKDIWELLP